MLEPSKLNPSNADPSIFDGKDLDTQKDDKISLQDNKKTIKENPESVQTIDLKDYLRLPSLSAVTAGIAFGAARIIERSIKNFPLDCSHYDYVFSTKRKPKYHVWNSNNYQVYFNSFF